jgi:hypothetical protein
MEKVATIVRWLVGTVFIVSGLVKANDPLGLSYKMQEFFEVWHTPFLNEFSLPLAIGMNTAEIVAGVALLVLWQPKKIVQFLLLLTVFFTFLTGYAYLSGQFKSCGCFGDCLPLTPLASFLKDVVLLILLGLLLNWYKNSPNKAAKLPFYTTLVAAAATLGLQAYTLRYLPIVDCLPYKVGNNIAEQMKIPAGAIPDSFAITFQYKKEGKLVEFGMDDFPADFDDSIYTFVNRYDKLIRKGTAQAAIADFALLSLQRTDTTVAILNQPQPYILVLVKQPETPSSWIDKNFIELQKVAATKNIPLLVVTHNPEAVTKVWNKPNQVLIADYTVLKTFGRTNTTFVYMRQGTIVAKTSQHCLGAFLEAIQN